jgi:outer membrane biosynthesis protein TonB
MGAAELLWGHGGDAAVAEPQKFVARVRSSVAEFQQRIASVDESRRVLLRRIDDQLDSIDYLHDDLLRQQEKEEREKFDYAITREARELPYRSMVMPWTRKGEDERRFRKTVLLVLLLALTFGGVIPFWEFPARDKDEVVEIPEHLVKLIKKEQPKPKPPEKKPEEKPKDEKKEEKKPTEQKPKPTPAETQQARTVAENSGLLAFKDNFTDLLEDDVDAKLGSAAKLTNSGAKASGDNSRNLVMSQAQDSSGGINTASLSKSVGGGAGRQMGNGVSFSRVQSGIGDIAGDDRPLSDGPGPSRSDEEIQIVFDRYKSALYRIYNKELRKNPLLRGKMILRLTIEPDGSVSMAKVESSDLDSAELSTNILERVRKFNFGPKEGVPKITILYPIDFLPAT